MKKTLTLCLFLLTSATALNAQKPLDLNAPAFGWGKPTWLELARKTFPDVQSRDNSFSSSKPIRLSPNVDVLYEIKNRARIVDAHAYVFDDEGRSRAVALYKLEAPDAPKLNLFVLAVYDAGPRFTLLDAVDMRSSDYGQASIGEPYSEFPADAADDKYVIDLKYSRPASDDSTEDSYRFLILEKDRLRLLIESPPVVNPTVCSDKKPISYSFSAEGMKLKNKRFRRYEYTYIRSLNWNSNCPIGSRHGILEHETQRAVWNAAARDFRREVVETESLVTGPQGTFDTNEFKNYPSDPTELEIGVGYRTEALYDTQTGKFRLAAPGKAPRGSTVEFEFELYRGLSAPETARLWRGTMRFQITTKAVRFLPGDKRQIYYRCLIYGFGDSRR